MKAASAYQRSGRTFFHAESKTTAGVWILSAPVLAAEKEEPAEYGPLVLAVLDASRDQVPHPVVWKGGFDPVLRLAGVKTWSSFVRSTKNVRIEREGERVLFIPCKNLGAKEGFEPMPQKQRTCVATPREVGRALMAAFGDSLD